VVVESVEEGLKGFLKWLFVQSAWTPCGDTQAGDSASGAARVAAAAGNRAAAPGPILDRARTAGKV
jgi:hypothetical protein